MYNSNIYRLRNNRNLLYYRHKEEVNMAKEFTCCFCGRPFYGYGNNAEPVIKNGVCCDECNLKKVIPARIKQLKGE